MFRRCSGPDLTVAVLLAFLAVTAGFGAQYLLWPAALLCASRRPAGYVYLFLASVYTGVFYLYALPRHRGCRFPARRRAGGMFGGADYRSSRQHALVRAAIGPGDRFVAPPAWTRRVSPCASPVMTPRKLQAGPP